MQSLKQTGGLTTGECTDIRYLQIRLCLPILYRWIFTIMMARFTQGFPRAVASVEVAVGEDQRGHQGPHVQGDADPAGWNLHPHRRPLAGHHLVIGVRAENIRKITDWLETRISHIYKCTNKCLWVTKVAQLVNKDKWCPIRHVQHITHMTSRSSGCVEKPRTVNFHPDL